ncbi:hypothetical protein V6B08_03055 [Ferrovibrio sp. MS7]|uniref:hypothetical protein n=1 Tax=Ferrovibrio plantarum TaxID=3119164 RepID=UPI0031352C2B
MLRMIYAYWQECAPAPGRLPGRRALDPLRIPRLLEYMWLVDVLPRSLSPNPGPRFRMRLVGGAMRRFGILAAPGDFIENLLPPDALPLRELHQLAEQRRPAWYRGPAYMPHDRELHALERIFLPMADDGETVDVVLGLTVFFDEQGREMLS